MVEARACQVAERVERGGMNVGITETVPGRTCSD